MYYTDKFSGELQYDCLKYTVFDDIHSPDEFEPLFQHQFIFYCFSTTEKIDTKREKNKTMISNNDENIFSARTFEELKMMNITIFDLLIWSAPIDLTERYAAYLAGIVDVNTDFKQVFRNCTDLWFGPECQYTFDTNNSFSNVVKSVFDGRSHINDRQTRNENTTCYIHLSCTYRSWAPMCLDWREICDGKVDCINDGVDEENCFDLEKNECEDHEYRCQNGLCIPQEFLRDGDPYNPECLDRTDEGSLMMSFEACRTDPSFRCEEHSCRPDGLQNQQFPCGDGECSPFGLACANDRGTWIHQIRTSFESHNLCWMTMFCLTRVELRFDQQNNFAWCSNLTIFDAQNIIQKHCSPIFDFPPDFLLYGHIRLLYTNDNLALDDDELIAPLYVCYQKDLCGFLSPTINLTISSNESLTCLHYQELNFTNDAMSWDFIVSALQNLFHACSSIDNRTCSLDNNTSLFHCQNSTKYISKHRLLDGTRDCEGNEDENYGDSCVLNDKYRFKCQVDERCIVSSLVDDGNPNCRDETDEQYTYGWQYKKVINFQTLCDGFIELTPSVINGSEQTDETDCEHWLCNNTYTHCDGFWNCPDGADEVNCPWLTICPPSHHICISIVTHNITCIHIDKVNDGTIDCFGGTDERHYCRDQSFDWPPAVYLCQNSTDECLPTHLLCDNDPDCTSGDDEQYCLTKSEDMCEPSWMEKQDSGEKLLCQLDESRKPKIVYFSLNNFPNYSSSVLLTNQTSDKYKNNTSSSISETMSHTPLASWPSTWRCHRGLNIRFREQYKCLCPPSYYGDLCEYQNQRVSLTIRVRTEAEWRIVFSFVITLIDDNEQIIHSYDQFSYIAVRDCDTKFNIYLLYATRPKDATRNYSIRIDTFERHLFIHRVTWLYPIHFSFLPVHRMAVYLIIPWTTTVLDNCKLKCNHGDCIITMNNPKKPICKCDHGWSGKYCHIQQQCNCSVESLCMGSINNRSICLCRIGMFGPRCFLSENICQSEPCEHNGQCVSNDFGRRSELEYICICKDGYSGRNCERRDAHIEISFESNIKIPSSILVHFIDINMNAHPTRMTLFKKIEFNQNNAILFTHIQFELIFVQFDKKYYFSFYQSTQSYFESVSTVIISSHRCLSIDELFNSTICELHILRRLKFYHLPCQEDVNLVCFYDSIYICLCTIDRRANCFEFNHNISYNCRGQQICLNGGECFEDNSICPTASTCVCKDCFYGSRCQYSTKSFDLSLDIILGYHIQSNLEFYQQTSIVKFGISLVIVMSTIGLISGIFSILTFQAKNSQKAGCGIYLLCASVVSLLLIIMFSWKMIFLIVSHMGLVRKRSFLLSNCIMTDIFLRICLSTNDWLNACVATERAVAIIKGPYFDLAQSKRVSKYVIVIVLLLIVISALPDPFHRSLVDDLKDSNPWCVIHYSHLFALVNSIVVVFHFVIPFVINIISALVIIIMTARQKSTAQRQVTRSEHIRRQFRQHKHLLISPCLLVILALPRLIMSFLSGCMSSTRDSWFFLCGYLISFIPPILTFFIFVLPSETYTSEFLVTMKLRRIKYP